MRMLTRVSPAADLNDVHGRLNRLFGDFLGGPMLLNDATGRGTSFVPSLDAHETADEVVITMEIAGVDPATLDISTSGDELVIKGEKPRREFPEDAKWTHAESVGGTFMRTVSVPVAIDGDAIQADARLGILTIRLPKRAEVKPKRIEVKAQ